MCHCLIVAEITCPEVHAPDNGDTMFSTSPNENGNYEFGTTVMYRCDNGFGLNPGPMTRTCGGNDSSVVGTFDGFSPTCDGK